MTLVINVLRQPRAIKSPNKILLGLEIVVASELVLALEPKEIGCRTLSGRYLNAVSSSLPGTLKKCE